MSYKYLWSHIDFEKWMKDEIRKLREEKGVIVGTANGTKLLTDSFLKPNNVHLIDLIRPKIKVRRWKRNKL